MFSALALKYAKVNFAYLARLFVSYSGDQSLDSKY